MTETKRPNPVDDALADLAEMEEATLVTAGITDEPTKPAAEPAVESDSSKAADKSPELTAALAELDDMEEIAKADADSKADLETLAAVETDGVIAEAKAEAYAEAGIKDDSEPVLAPKAATAPAAETVPETKAASTPRVLLGRTPIVDQLTKKFGSSELAIDQLCKAFDTDSLDATKRDEWVKAKIDEVEHGQKKVGTKFVNAIATAAGSAKLECYTYIGLMLLLEKGQMTSNDLYGKYLDRPYKDGTARAQSGQLMQLLPMLGIAERTGQTLTLQDDAPLTVKMAKLLGVELEKETAA